MSKYMNIDGRLRVIKDDELYHWKYIYKEKVNGKWRYYYTEPTLKDRIKGKLGYAEKDFADIARGNYKKAKEAMSYYRQQLKGTTTSTRRRLLENDMKTAKAIRGYEYSGYRQALRDYGDTPLYKVRSARKKAVAKGKRFVESVSKKIKNVGKKTKSTVVKGKNFIGSITKKNGSTVDGRVSNVSSKRRAETKKTYTGAKKNRSTMDIGVSSVSSKRRYKSRR